MNIWRNIHSASISQSLLQKYFVLCTQEYNIDKITSSVVQRAKQLCPSIPARIQEAEDLALKYNQLLKLFAQCHFAYSTSQWLDDKQIHQLGKYFVIFIGV
jgi:hypothetical protein